MNSKEYANDLLKRWVGPKSLCQCGHTGDGAYSAHGGVNGHGQCHRGGCACEQFTWDSFLPEFQSLLAERKAILDAQEK